MVMVNTKERKFYMTEKYTEISGTLIAHLKGELDQHNAVKLRINLDKKIMDGTSHLVFDLSELDFMDSSGIGIIIGRYKNITALGGTASVAGAKPHVEKILRMAAIDRIIPIYSDVEGALLRLGGEAIG